MGQPLLLPIPLALRKWQLDHSAVTNKLGHDSSHCPPCGDTQRGAGAKDRKKHRCVCEAWAQSGSSDSQQLGQQSYTEGQPYSLICGFVILCVS